MSISLRKFRALVFEYHDAGTGGVADSTYLVITSSAGDDMWWCSKALPNGKEVTTGMQAEHRVDAVFGFSAACPIDVDGAIQCDDKSYVVRAVLDRDYGRDEVQVYAEELVGQTLSTS